MATVTDRRRASRVGNQRSGGVLGELTDPAYREEVFYPALLDLGYDLAPGTGEVRSGLRADAAFGRAGQQIEQGQYLPAAGSLAEGTAEYLGAIPALGFAASLPGDTARFLKRIMPKPEKFSKVRGGQYQDMTGVENMMESGPEMEFGTVVPSANIDVTQKDPLNTMRVEKGILDTSPVAATKANKEEFGPQTWRTNLFRQVKNRKRKDGSSYQTRLWSWVDKPEGVIDNAPVVSLHKGSDHVYVLDATYDNPAELARSPQARLAMERGTKIEEPSMMPTTRGSLYLGNKVGTIKTPQGIRDVYDQAAIAKPGQENFKGLTPAPKDFFQKSEARAEKVEPMPTAPAQIATRQYEDQSGLLDFSKLETDYPPVEQTREPLFVPKKEKVPDELKIFKTKDQQKKLTDWFDSGMKTGGAAWYNTNPLRKFAIDEFGEEKGLPLYDRFMRYVAALSPNTAPVPNIKQASYFNTLDEAGVPLGVFQEGQLDIPAGYGRMSMKGVANTLAAAQNPTRGPLYDPSGVDIKTKGIPKFAQEGYEGMFGATAPKVGRFYQNLVGNIEDMATLDAGAMRALAGKTGPDGKLRPSAGKEIYNQMEISFNDFAKKLGVEPAKAQAAIWTGSAPYTGVGKRTSGLPEGASFMEMMMQRVKITADELGMKPKDVLKGVLEGNTVLKNMVGPIAVGGGILAVSRDDES